MQQLNGVDAFHVLEETRRQHMHTIKIAILQPSPADPITLDRVHEWVAGRLAHIPPLRWKVVPAPLRMGRPVWYDAGPPDPRQHVRAATLPAPGDDAALDALVSRVLSEPLDRSRPLWELTYVDGLAGGRVALVFKLHHSIMDGQASLRFLETAFESAEPFPYPRSHVTPERAPSRRQVARHILREQGKQWAALPSVVKRSIDSIQDNRSLKKAGAPPVVNPLSGPLTRFNAKPAKERIYVDVTVPLADVLAIKDALGATVNDVYVALCGGAVRRYLEEKGELRDRPLNCALPVSLRGPHQLDDFGNCTSYWYVALGTEIADPVERLARVEDSTAAARQWAQGDVDLFAVWMDYYLLFGTVTLRTLGVVETLTKRPLFNCIVSNVKGPRPLSLYGAPVVAVRSAGPIRGRLGLNLTAWSYRDDFSIGLHACREQMPDLRRLGEHLRAELADFTAAAQRVSRASAGRGPGSSSAPSASSRRRRDTTPR